MRVSVLSLCVLTCLAAFASGCNEDRSFAQPSRLASALDQLPDCDGIDVKSTFEAKPASIDGFYIVSDGTRPVCQTDFDGLQAIASRLDGTSVDSLQTDRLSSDPMPGRGTDPDPRAKTESDPMPGHGTNPVAVTSHQLTSGAAK